MIIKVSSWSVPLVLSPGVTSGNFVPSCRRMIKFSQLCGYSLIVRLFKFRSVLDCLLIKHATPCQTDRTGDYRVLLQVCLLLGTLLPVRSLLFGSVYPYGKSIKTRLYVVEAVYIKYFVLKLQR